MQRTHSLSIFEKNCLFLFYIFPVKFVLYSVIILQLLLYLILLVVTKDIKIFQQGKNKMMYFENKVKIKTKYISKHATFQLFFKMEPRSDVSLSKV